MLPGVALHKGGLAVHDHQDVPYVKSVVVANPAPGADFSLAAPGQGSWRVLSLRAHLLASAAVATRVPTLLVTGSDGIVAQLVGTGSVAAGAAADWSGFAGAGNVAGATAVHQWSFPTDGVLLLPGFTLSSLTAAIDVADQWSLVRALVVEYPTGPLWRLTPDVSMFVEPRV